MSAENAEIRERLARMETSLEHQKTTAERIEGKLDGMSERLRSVEVKSATYGTISGGIISIAVGLITARLKTGA